MMAVGLNIVVGYAGLLDLGYVAFYANGAYTAAWLASLQFAASAQRPRRMRVGDRPDALPGLHARSGCCSLAGVITAFFGI